MMMTTTWSNEMSDYIYETANYGVRVGKSQSPDNADNDVYQIVHKEYGVVEFETREIGQACFRCNVVQRFVDTGEWKKQWLNYVHQQEVTEAQIEAEAHGISADPEVAEVSPGEIIPGESAPKVVKHN
jgi:hypothetical protein